MTDKLAEMEYRELTNEEFSDIQARILYEDNHIIVFNKRPGEIIQGDKTGDEPLGETLKAFVAMRDSKPGKVFMGVPHRLDRPVSGICLFAKTSKALERLSAMFRGSDVHKFYWALVCEQPRLPREELENYLGRDEKRNKAYVTSGPKGEAKLAKLIYSYIGKTERYHLVEVELLTGRHHQIRCQLSSAGMHIKGDLKYGAPRSNPDGGICLHARRVQFLHPVKKEPLVIEAPVPASWPQADLF